jgi:3-dehydroquinate synthetase
VTLTTVQVATDPPYPVRVGPGALAELPRLTAGAKGLALLVDERVLELHGEALAGLSHAPRLVLTGGEGAKTLERLGQVLEFLAGAGLSRQSMLVTFGGGSLGDLGGLAASLFKRGMDVIHAPTTLLAQVDASVGGKTAINLAAGKNLAGTFHQPVAVLCDTLTLSTLSADERASGLGEVLKTALVGGESDLRALEGVAGELVAGDAAATAATVAGCVAVKARVVAEDPTERGARRALNLGHTFAHGIEHAAGYGVVPHGVAVAAGVGLALEAGSRAGLLEDTGLIDRLRELQVRLGLPPDLAALRKTSGLELPASQLLAGLAQDKKGAVGRPEFVLPRSPGNLALGIELDPGLIRELLA